MADEIEQKSWQCVAKALNEFEGNKLIRKWLHCDGEFCAIGAALTVARVPDVEKTGPRNIGLSQGLYEEFQRRFKLDPTHVYVANDHFDGNDEDRLTYMRNFARLMGEGMETTLARNEAWRLTYQKTE